VESVCPSISKYTPRFSALSCAMASSTSDRASVETAARLTGKVTLSLERVTV
jgi:hypothetical protein